MEEPRQSKRTPGSEIVCTRRGRRGLGGTDDEIIAWRQKCLASPTLSTELVRKLHFLLATTIHITGLPVKPAGRRQSWRRLKAVSLYQNRKRNRLYLTGAPIDTHPIWQLTAWNLASTLSANM